MRGTKAKRLRKMGLKSGPSSRAEMTNSEIRKAEKKIQQAKAPYSETRSVPKTFGGFSAKVRESIAKKREEKKNP